MRLWLLPLLLASSCNSRQPTRLVGKGGTEINLGGIQNFAAQGYMSAGFDKNGNPRLTIRDNSEAVASRALDVAGVAYGGYVLAGVEKAGQAADLAATKSNNARALGEKAIESKTTLGLGAQGVETIKATTLPQ